MTTKTTILRMSIFLICSISIFYHLGEKPLNLWDESRRAINAYEMYDNGLSIVTTYSNEPEMWGTKPPLLIWSQALSFHLLGINLFALRLPSAMAGTIIVIILMLTLRRYSQDELSWVLAPLILVTIPAFMEYHHSVKSGDFDALLSLWVLCSVLTFYNFLEEGKGQYLLWFFVFLSLAVITKSIAGLFVLPALAIFTAIRGHIRRLFLNQYFYLGLLVFLVVVGTYYTFREHVNPGYLEAVWNNELVGRYLNTLEGHKRPWFFFFIQLCSKRYSFWWLIFLLSPLVIFTWGNRSQKRFGSYLWCLVLVQLLVISFSKTKLAWYDFQIIPFVAILTAMSISVVLKHWRPKLRRDLMKWIMVLVSLFYFVVPYGNIIRKYSKTKLNHQYQKHDRMNFFLHGLYRTGTKDETLCSIAYFDYHPNLEFYRKMLRSRNNHIHFIDNVRAKLGECVYVEREKDLKLLMDRFNFSVVDTIQNLFIVKVE